MGERHGDELYGEEEAEKEPGVCVCVCVCVGAPHRGRKESSKLPIYVGDGLLIVERIMS